MLKCFAYRWIDGELVPESLFGFFEWGSDVLGILGHSRVRARGGAVPDLKHGDNDKYLAMEFCVYKLSSWLALSPPRDKSEQQNIWHTVEKSEKKWSQKLHTNQATALIVSVVGPLRNAKHHKICLQHSSHLREQWLANFTQLFCPLAARFLLEICQKGGWKQKRSWEGPRQEPRQKLVRAKTVPDFYQDIRFFWQVDLFLIQ